MIPIVDTHQHLCYTGRLAYAYPWTSIRPSQPGRTFAYDDYLREAAGSGIGSTVFVESTAMDPSGHDETAFVDSLSSSPGSMIDGIVAAAWPETDDFLAELDGFEGKRVVGVRRILHVEPDGLSREPRFRENLRRLPERGLTFDLCLLARQLPIGIELAKACPEVQFVLDHCGVPDIASANPGRWREHLLRLAEMPNVNCKVSGLLAYCAPQDAVLDVVRPFIEHSIEAFGWDRVVWGSDWPIVETTSTLRDWVSITRQVVAGGSEANQHKLFHLNAKRIYKLVGRND